MSNILARLTYTTLYIGAAVTLWFMFRSGAGNGPLEWLLAIPFAAWAVAPFAGAGFFARMLREAKVSSAILLVAALLLTSTAAYILYQSFVVHIDAQSALVFVFLPVWQIGGLAPFVIAAFLLRRRG